MKDGMICVVLLNRSDMLCFETGPLGLFFLCTEEEKEAEEPVAIPMTSSRKYDMGSKIGLHDIVTEEEVNHYNFLGHNVFFFTR
jgi:hypothetical protein